MWYTIIFYVLLFVVSFKKGHKALLWSGIIAALYYGLRYDYMPDYMAYYRCFNAFAQPNYVFDRDYEHFEYGWYVLNKIFSPFGFFFFVFVCSCIFSYGIHKTIQKFDFSIKYLSLVLVGYFTQPSTAVLSSAQRQFLVTGIFLIAYVKLIYNNNDRFSKLWSKEYIIYYLIILLCSTFHTSAFALLFIPLIVVMPRKTKFFIPILAVIVFLFLYFGPKYLPELLGAYIMETGNFSSLENTLEESTSGDLTLVATLMYGIQLVLFIFAFRLKNITRDERFALIIAIVCILLNMTSYYMQEVYRIGMYLQLFVYISLAIVCRRYPIPYNKFAFVVAWIWILWNAAKILQPMREIDTYKSVFSLLF